MLAAIPIFRKLQKDTQEQSRKTEMAILWCNRLGGREKPWCKKHVVVMGHKPDRITLRVEEKNGGAQARPRSVA